MLGSHLKDICIIFPYQILMCPEHEMERVNMYCEICRRPVCHLCKLGGTHANHRVTSMSSAYKILKVSGVGKQGIRYLGGLKTSLDHLPEYRFIFANKDVIFKQCVELWQHFGSKKKVSHFLCIKKCISPLIKKQLKEAYNKKSIHGE